MFIRVAGMDPSFANYGIVAMDVPVQRGKPLLRAMRLISTDGRDRKVVRKNSDDMRRAAELHAGVGEFIAGNKCTLAMAEIPQGAQSARAAWCLGIALGVIAGVQIQIIQVSPIETKLATVGSKTASKAEMIEWAVSEYPDANWLTHKSKGKIIYSAANEHLADAVAVTHAGMKSEQFQQLVTIMGSVRAVSRDVSGFALG